LFDIKSTNSLQEAERYVEKIWRVKDEDFVPMVLVGTKCDLENERTVSIDDAMEIAKKYKIPYFESSAKVCINVEEVIFALIDEIYRKRDEPIRDDKRPSKDCLMM
jgi:small GTP-binding protein